MADGAWLRGTLKATHGKTFASPNEPSRKLAARPPPDALGGCAAELSLSSPTPELSPPKRPLQPLRAPAPLQTISASATAPIAQRTFGSDLVSARLLSRP